MEGIDQGWRKSSYSGNGGECVEVANIWRKSSYSNNVAECVEVARNRPRVIAVRDSKDPQGPVLAVEPAEWRSFIADVKARTHDLA